MSWVGPWFSNLCACHASSRMMSELLLSRGCLAVVLELFSTPNVCFKFYTGNLNSETPGDRKNVFLHCGDVLGVVDVLSWVMYHLVSCRADAELSVSHQLLQHFRAGPGLPRFPGALHFQRHDAWRRWQVLAIQQAT